MLKSLDLNGFKSFAEPTRFEFSAGITCVVGPNGSGKSNVVDSVKWILGDQSPKSLRGTEMADVIFNGSKSRKPSGLAEAILTFDNQSGFLGIDATEVQIGRRLYRSGDSEYLLNGNVVRLKDIRDLMMGTGAGTSAYAIIEQGRVGQILQGNPQSRRVLLEEAAGISRFKQRRIEAQRKLDRVNQNLARLKDIVDEVETQLVNAKGQANKATKYREVSGRLKTWWLGLAADDYRLLEQRRQNTISKVEPLKQQSQEFSAQLQELDQLKEKLDQQISHAEQIARESQQKVSTLRSAYAERNANVRMLRERVQEFEADAQRLGQHRLRLLKRYHDAHTELTRTEDQLSSRDTEESPVHQQVKQLQQQLETTTQQRQEVETELSAVEQEQSILSQKHQNSTQKQQSLESQLETVDNAITRLKKQLEQTMKRREDALADLQAAQEIYDEQLSGLTEYQQQLQSIEESQKRLKAQVEDVQKLIAKHRERRSGDQARYKVLEQMDQQGLGLTLGTRELLQRAKKNAQAPWCHIQGLVSQQIDVDFEYAAFIELALGERAEWIIVDSLEPFLHYLQEHSLPVSGRVGFVGLDGLNRQSAVIAEGDEQDSLTSPQQLELGDQPGVMSRADRLVKSVTNLGGLTDLLLADTWVVETLEVAHQLSQQHPQLRFLTMQGELIEAGCRLFLGSATSESTSVTRRSELRKLKREIDHLDRTLADLDQQQGELNEVFAQIQEQLQQLQASAEGKSQKLARLKATLEMHQRDVHNINTELSNQHEDAERLTNHRQQILRDTESLQTELQQANDSQQELEQKQQQLLTKQQTILKTESELQNERQKLNVELAREEERLRSREQSLESSREELRQRKEQLEEANRRLEAVGERAQKLTGQLLTHQSEGFELAIDLDQLQQVQQKDDETLNASRIQKRNLDQQHLKLRDQLRSCEDQLRSCELQLHDDTKELSTLGDRIQEEYQLSLEEVASSQTSAFHTYLQENFSLSEEEISEQNSSTETQQQTETIDQELIEADATTDAPWKDLTFTDVRDELVAEVERLKRKLKSIGNVDTDSLQNLDELEQRYTFLSTQLTDLMEAQASLEAILKRLGNESERLFRETYDSIRTHFKDLFRKLFGGGEGDIILEDPNDILECGIEIVARPPGKELRSLGLLSGGEKTMTAVALLMSIFKNRPSPFCILDEVDAALDEANIDRFTTVVKEFQQMTQFVIISHRKRTMTICDRIFGVTMEQAGISKRLILNFDDVAENGEFNAQPNQAA